MHASYTHGSLTQLFILRKKQKKVGITNSLNNIGAEKQNKQLSLVLDNGDLSVNAGLDLDVGDLLDNVGGAVEIENALVDSHLPAVEGVGTFTARGLADAKLEDLGGHAHGASHLELSALGLGLELSANLLHGINPLGGESDADVVDRDFLSTLGELIEM